MISLDRYIDFVLGRRWWVLAFVTLFMLAMAAGAGNINVAYDYRLLLGKDNPQLADFNALEDTYTSSNTALIAIAPRKSALFTRETLAAVEELTEAAWLTPGVTRVDSLTNFSHSSAHGDELVVAPLVTDAASLSDAELARIKSIALNSTDLTGRLVSSDGRVAGLAISFTKADREGRMVTEATEYLAGVLNEARQRHANLDYYLTGNVVLNHSIAAVTADDSATLIPIAFLVVLTGAALLLRTLFGTVSIVFVILFSIGTAVGFAGWIGMLFTPVTSFLPSIVMVISVAHAVHIISTALSHLRAGLDRRAAIAESLRSNTYPVFLTSLTTAIGFLCLNSSDSPPFRDLGNIVAFGVLCAFFYAMTLLPALLSIFPLHAPAARSDGPPLFDRFGDFVVARRKTLLWSVGLVAVIVAAGIPRLHLSDDWTKDFSQRHQFRQDTDFVIDNLTGLNMLEFSLDSGREGGITEPAYLRAVDAFAEWFRGQPEVTHVQAFPDVMKRLNQNMHADDPAFYRLPEDAELSAQYLLLYELSLPFGRDMNDRIDVAKSATRMTVTVGNASAPELRELDKRAQVWLRANHPEFVGDASGMTMIFAHLTQRNMQSMILGMAIGLPLISFILMLFLRNLRLGLLSLLPNALPRSPDIRSVGLHVRPHRTRGFDCDDHRLRYHRGRYDSLHDEVYQGASRGPRRGRCRTFELQQRWSRPVDDDCDPVGGICDLYPVALHDQCDPGTHGHDYAALRAAHRFPAAPAGADGHRQGEEAMGRPGRSILPPRAR